MMGLFGSVFFVLFTVLFVFVFVMCIGTFFRSFRQDRKNDKSPRLTVEAEVVAKRMHVWGDHSHTQYYATFEVSSGDRMELLVPHDQYGYLVEHDRGRLSFQGSRFLDFERT